MLPRRVTPGRRTTSAKPALFAERPENSSVAENVEQRLRMRRSWRQKGRLQPGCRPEGIAREGGSALGCLHPIRTHRWKFTTCTQQRHGTNCVWPYIGTNHHFAITWCRNRAWDIFWDGIVLLILLQITQCGLLDKWHVAYCFCLKITTQRVD